MQRAARGRLERAGEAAGLAGGGVGRRPLQTGRCREQRQSWRRSASPRCQLVQLTSHWLPLETRPGAGATEKVGASSVKDPEETGR